VKNYGLVISEINVTLLHYSDLQKVIKYIIMIYSIDKYFYLIRYILKCSNTWILAYKGNSWYNKKYPL